MKSINNKGVTAVEYGLLAGLISIVMIGSVTLTGNKTDEIFCKVSNALTGTVIYNSNPCYEVANIDNSTIQQVQKTVSDTINMNVVPTDIGGNGVIGGPWLGLQYSQAMVNQLEEVNDADPIINVFGLFDWTTKQPITSYQGALDGFTENTKLSAGPYLVAGLSDAPHFEVTTQSGKVYDLNLWNGITEMNAK